MSGSERVREGGCFCGAIRYRVTGEPYRVAHCHCMHCRRSAGAPVQTWFEAKTAQVEWLSGTPKLHRQDTRVVRGFCDQCGTSITYACPEETPDDLDLVRGQVDRVRVGAGLGYFLGRPFRHLESGSALRPFVVRSGGNPREQNRRRACDQKKAGR